LITAPSFEPESSLTMNAFRQLARSLRPTIDLRAARLLLIGLLSFSAADSLRAAPVYRLQSTLSSGLKVGEEISPWESLIIVLRPSPGDNFWYRLPHTVQVTGDLPPGIRLEQKGAGFHDLARFAGTPTQAGQFTVQLQATMADGLTTTQESVTFSITDPRAESYTVQTWGLSRFREGQQVGNAGAFLVSQSHSLLKAPATVQATGLPAGVTVAESGSPGYYSIQGAPEVAGKFSVKLAFSWPDGAPIAETSVDLEVLPADYQPQQTLSVVVLGPIRKNVAYAPHGYRAPFLYVEDEFGARSSEQLTISVTGLPSGLSIDSQSPGSVFVVGRATETGTFTVTFRATLPDGTTTNEVETSIEVLPAIPFADAAGTYDSVVQRSEELNGNNGGRLRFTLTRGGQTTGFLIHKLVRYPFSSAAVTLDPDTGDVTITPPGAGVTVSGSIVLSDEYSSGSPQPYFTFSGEVTNASSSAAVNGARATVRSAADPSPYASAQKINLVFVNDDDSSSTAGQPSGAGFLAASINSVGNVTLTVWAPDGSAPVSLATTLSETSYGATFPVYFILPNSSGSSTLAGQIFVNADGDAAGELSWYQSATNRGAFPDGISLVEYTGVIGSRYTPEPTGLNLLGLEESIKTAQLDLIGEDVPAEPEVALTVQRASMKVASSAKVSGVRMQFDKKTGILTGSLTLPATKTSRARAVTFRGVRTPKGTGIIGHFTAPSAAKATRRAAGTLKISAR
jgi:hypothetical protein